MMKKFYFIFLLLLIPITTILFSCNAPLSFNRNIVDNKVDITLPKKKVLLITVEGAKGAVMKDCNIPNVSSLLPNSIYSWDAVCDTVSTDHASLSSLFTGAKNNKNNILSNTYQDNNFSAFPSFFSRISNSKALDIVLINDDPAVNDTLLQSDSANKTIKVSTDKEVEEAAIDELSSKDPNVLSIVFKSVNEAGKNSGFSSASISYIKSIEQVDEYVGEILSTLKDRKHYAREDWLIILTSNHGGNPDGTYGGSSDVERNGFVVYYNPSFPNKEIKIPSVNVPYSGAFPFFFRKDGVDHAAYSDDPVFNFGSGQDFTVEFNIKADVTTNRSYNPIIDNKSWHYASVGWLVDLEDEVIKVYYTGTEGDMRTLANGPVVTDGRWHHITITFDRDGNITLYKDGTLFVQGPSIQNTGSIDSGSPLAVGTDGTLNYDQYGPNSASIDAFISDVRIWKALLAPKTIDTWSFIPITPSHPDYDNLLAYWKLRDGSEGDVKAKDFGPNSIDLTIENGLQWEEVDDVLNPSKIDATQYVPHNVDVSVNIMAWLGVKIEPEWNLDGKLYILGN